MILEKTNASTELVIGDIEKLNYSIQTNPKLYNILSSKIYTDKIMAPIRELLCNAWDAHIAANNTETAIEVAFSGLDDVDAEVQLSIRDYGTGLSKEQMTELYLSYGASNKDESDAYTGCLGLGSKSPFAYTNEFTVTSFYKGHEYIYELSNDGGIPHGHAIPGRSTKEHDGLCVSFPIERSDVGRFSEALNKFCYTFHGNVVVYDSRRSPAAYSPEKMEFKDPFGVGVFAKPTPYWAESRDVSVIMGGVLYTYPVVELRPTSDLVVGEDIVPENKAAELLRTLAESTSFRFIIAAPMGSVDFDVAREHCELTDKTKAFVCAKLVEYHNAALAEFNRSSEAALTPFDKAVAAVKFLNEHKELDRALAWDKICCDFYTRIRDNFNALVGQQTGLQSVNLYRSGCGDSARAMRTGFCKLPTQLWQLSHQKSIRGFVLSVADGTHRVVDCSAKGIADPVASQWVRSGIRAGGQALCLLSKQLVKLFSDAGVPVTTIDSLKDELKKRGYVVKKSSKTKTDVKPIAERKAYRVYGFEPIPANVFHRQYSLFCDVADEPVADISKEKCVVVPYDANRMADVEVREDIAKLFKLKTPISDEVAVVLIRLLAAVGWRCLAIPCKHVRTLKQLKELGAYSVSDAVAEFMRENAMSRADVVRTLLAVTFQNTTRRQHRHFELPLTYVDKKDAAVIKKLRSAAAPELDKTKQAALIFWAIKFFGTSCCSYSYGANTDSFVCISDTLELRRVLNRTKDTLLKIYPVLNQFKHTLAGDVFDQVEFNGYTHNDFNIEQYVEAMQLYWKKHGFNPNN